MNQREYEEYQYQREAARQLRFATESIQMKVADAKAAGIAPLAALGVPSFQSSPIMVDGGGSGTYGSGGAGGYSHVPYQTQEQETDEMLALAIENRKLQNKLLEAQIAESQARVKGITGVKPMPSMVTSSGPVPGIDAGVKNALGQYVFPDGSQMYAAGADAAIQLLPGILSGLEYDYKSKVRPAARFYMSGIRDLIENFKARSEAREVNAMAEYRRYRGR